MVFYCTFKPHFLCLVECMQKSMSASALCFFHTLHTCLLVSSVEIKVETSEYIYICFQKTEITVETKETLPITPVQNVITRTEKKM